MLPREKYNTIILGGGAAGLMCACILSSLGIDDIAVIERNPRVGKKLLMTGNGRCNLTADGIKASDYNTDDPQKLSKILNKFDVSAVKSFFENELNISLTSKNGLIYPRTLKSSSVLDGLRFYCEDHGVKFFTDTTVDKISENIINDQFEADNIVFAMGGCAAPESGSDGKVYSLLKTIVTKSDFEPVCPSLVQMTLSDKDIRKLSGTRANAEVRLIVDRNETGCESGEILFTDYGVSGICVMQLSGIYNRARSKGLKKAELVVDLLPEMTEEKASEEIRRRLSSASTRSKAEKLSGLVPKTLAEVMIDRGGDVVKQMKGFTLSVTGTLGFETAQVTSGGLKLNALTEHLSLKNNDSIFVIGETVNVDGPCGGYNLQWAWSSASAAAHHIAGRE